MDQTSNTVVIKYYSTKFVFEKTNRETSETIYIVSMDCPESDSGFGDISLSEHDVKFSYDEKHCNLTLGNPQKNRRIRIKLNGHYVYRYYPNKQIEDWHKDYLRARRTANRIRRMEILTGEYYTCDPE